MSLVNRDRFDSTTGWLLAMAGLAAFALDQATRDAADSAAAAAGHSAVLVVGMIVGCLLIARRDVPDWLANGLGIAAFLLPFGIEGVRRSLFNQGWPLEVVLLVSLRNILLVMGVLASRQLAANLAAGAGAFAFLFALSVADGTQPIPFLFGFWLISCCAWLACRYWREFDLAARRAGCRARMPLPALSVMGIVVVAAFALAEAGPRRVAHLLGQLVPSSGGTQRHDPVARGGVGDDGQDTVNSAGKPKSDGGQGDSYIESHERTFYDVASDMYGEAKKPKDHNRAVSIAAEKIHSDHDHAKHRQASRHFTVYRRSPTDARRRGKDLATDAVLHVGGPTPAHIPSKSFGEFDGENWVEELSSRDPRVIAEGAFRWMRIELWRQGTPSSPAYYRGSLGHTIKTACSLGKIVPLPAQAIAFRVGAVDRADFFHFQASGVIGLSDPESVMPSGEFVEATSATLSTERLRALEFPADAPFSYPIYRTLPEGDASQRIAEIAGSWTKGVPFGWRTVEAIVGRLRSGEFRHDRSVQTPDGCNAILQFLTASKSGPDYLFASAAALLLRSQGIPARLTGGWYVNPERTDAWTRSTPVMKADLHFWVEVLLPDGHGATVEPTPGYDLAPYCPTWSEWLTERLATMAIWLGKRPLATLGALLILSLAWIRRRDIADLFLTLSWHVLARGQWRRRVTWTAKILDWRARIAGRRRLPGATIKVWLDAQRVDLSAADHDAFHRLAALADLAWYGPFSPAPADCDTVCRGVVARGWRRFGQASTKRQSESKLLKGTL